jgi:hypothetical protein
MIIGAVEPASGAAKVIANYAEVCHRVGRQYDAMFASALRKPFSGKK